MRISDWSSDVCSSDLRTNNDAEAEANRAIRVDDSFARALHAMATCPSKIVTIGMGKAGFVARRFAATLASTATPAFYVHPSEAAHGDLGHIEDGDCLIAFSTSGKTREVLEERTSGGKGQSVSVRVDMGGRGIMKKKTKQ